MELLLQSDNKPFERNKETRFNRKNRESKPILRWKV